MAASGEVTYAAIISARKNSTAVETLEEEVTRDEFNSALKDVIAEQKMKRKAEDHLAMDRDSAADTIGNSEQQAAPEITPGAPAITPQTGQLKRQKTCKQCGCKGPHLPNSTCLSLKRNRKD